MNLIKRLWTEESGQGMTEYALIIGLIALAAVIAITAFGDALSAWFNALAGRIPIEAPNP